MDSVRLASGRPETSTPRRANRRSQRLLDEMDALLIRNRALLFKPIHPGRSRSPMDAEEAQDVSHKGHDVLSVFDEATARAVEANFKIALETHAEMASRWLSLCFYAYASALEGR
jgi:hypothetical protein